MKSIFDVVVGNPPFKVTRSKTIWAKFSMLAMNLADIVAFITPGNWRIGHIKIYAEVQSMIYSHLQYAKNIDGAFGRIRPVQAVDYWIWNKNLPQKMKDINGYLFLKQELTQELYDYITDPGPYLPFSAGHDCKKPGKYPVANTIPKIRNEDYNYCFKKPPGYDYIKVVVSNFFWDTFGAWLPRGIGAGHHLWWMPVNSLEEAKIVSEKIQNLKQPRQIIQESRARGGAAVGFANIIKTIPRRLVYDI